MKPNIQLAPGMHGALLHSPIHLHVILLTHAHNIIFTLCDTLVMKLVKQNKMHMQGNVVCLYAPGFFGIRILLRNQLHHSFAKYQGSRYWL
jgi:hypothetical protein